MLERLAKLGGTSGERLKFGLWGGGVLAVFVFHLVALVGAAASGEHPARVWSILVLIAAPVTVVCLIGGAFARSGRGADEGGTDGAEPRSESNLDR